jgi:cobalt-zinc-cadmium efflux system outer membrane protein
MLLPAVGCATLDEPATPAPNFPFTAASNANPFSSEAKIEQNRVDGAARMSSHQDNPEAGEQVLFAQDKVEQPGAKAKEGSELPLLKPPELNIPKTAPGKAITLDRAINTTLLADPIIRAGFETINQANADSLTASLRPNPSLFTDAQLLPLTRPFTPSQTGGPPQMDALLSYPIDWFLFGKRAANMAAAQLGVKASLADFNDLIRRRVTDTAIYYYDMLEAKALLTLAKQDVAYFEQVEAITRRAVVKGGRPEVDLKRIELDLLTSRRTLRETELMLVVAQSHLRAMMGHENSDAAFDVEGDLRTHLSAEPIGVEQAFQLAVENRPDIESNRLRITEALTRVDVENRKAYPDLIPQIGYTRQFQTQALGIPDANSYEIGLTTTLPIINRNQGNRNKALSIVAQSRYQLQASLVNLRAELEQAAQAFRTAYQNATSVAEEQVKLATEVRDTINQAYAAGGRPLLDVLDAERNYRETYRTYITGRANYWRSLYRLNAAIGKQVVK